MSDDDVVHRGIRWQRSTSGALRWRDDDRDSWIRYKPGDDAPPRPPGWERSRRRALPKLSLERPAWRSPYRVVPIVLLIAILAFGAWQALRGSGGQVAAEARAAARLSGQCLAAKGFAAGQPQYGSTPVSCTAPGAVVEVREVLPGTPGSPTCPQGTTTVVLAYAGVRYPHHLCVVANGRG